MDTNTKLITIVPCYNEEAVLEDTHQKLSALYDTMIADKLIVPESSILYVNDGSKDNTWSIIEKLNDTSPYCLWFEAGPQRGSPERIVSRS